MSGLTRAGTAKPVRETKISGANGDRENTIFPVQLDHEQNWQPYMVNNFQHAHFIPIVGAGKERRTLIGPW